MEFSHDLPGIRFGVPHCAVTSGAALRMLGCLSFPFWLRRCDEVRGNASEYDILSIMSSFQRHG